MHTTVLVVAVLLSLGGLSMIVAAVLMANGEIRGTRPNAGLAAVIVGLLFHLAAINTAVLGLPSGHPYYPPENGMHQERLAALVSLIASGAGWASLFLGLVASEMWKWRSSEQSVAAGQKAVFVVSAVLELLALAVITGNLLHRWHPWALYLGWTQNSASLGIVLVALALVIIGKFRHRKQQRGTT